MANSQIDRHVVVQGDLPLAAAGQPFFSVVGRRIVYNVRVGEPFAIIYPKSGIPQTIDAAGLTADNVHRVRFGVGHSTKGSSVLADSVRYIGAPEIGNCNIEHISTSSPKCGNPEVRDMYFDCTACDETYTISVEYRDNFTRSHTKINAEWAKYLGSYTTNCKQCNDCDTTVTCDEVVDGVIESILQEKPLMVREGQPYPDYPGTQTNLPFDIHKLYSRSLVYCLGFGDIDGECENCTTLDSFVSATVDGVAIDLSGLVDPTDDSMIYREQLETVALLINQAFKDSAVVDGRAYITGVNYSKCCPLQLHINTDDAAFALETVAGVLAPAKDYDPFAAGEAGEGFTCGIRVITAPLSADCECYITKPLASYISQVRITAIGDGFKDSKEATIQRAEIPGQFGSQIQYEELYQDVGGSGRNYSAGAQRGTWTGVPRKDDRLVQAITARCDKDYCSYYIRSRVTPLTSTFQTGEYVINSKIHVESDALVANAAIKEFLDAWALLSMSCVDAPETTCTPLIVSC